MHNTRVTNHDLGSYVQNSAPTYDYSETVHGAYIDGNYHDLAVNYNAGVQQIGLQNMKASDHVIAVRPGHVRIVHHLQNMKASDHVIAVHPGHVRFVHHLQNLKSNKDIWCDMHDRKVHRCLV